MGKKHPACGYLPAAAFLLLAPGFCASCKKEIPAGKEHIADSPVPPLPAEPHEPAGTDTPGGPLLLNAPAPPLTYYSAGGKAYDSMWDLEEAEDKAGFEQLGSFGANWPCRIISTETALGELRFDLESTGPQAYTGYAGRELKLYRLICINNKEAAAIFKSRKKKAAAKAK